jgi:hypothetical protein
VVDEAGVMWAVTCGGGGATAASSGRLAPAAATRVEVSVRVCWGRRRR